MDANQTDITEQLNSQIDGFLRPDAFDWEDDVEEQMAQDAAELEISESDERLFEQLQPVTYAQKDAGNAESIPENNMPIHDDSPVSIESNDMPLIIDGSAPSYPVENQSSHYAQARAQVSQELAWRDYCTHIDPEIHHFNWLGSPVYESSQTPPAESLLYLLSAPKIPQPCDELKWQSILSRATTYVDPVLIYLSCGWDDLQTKGQELVRFATGRTFKFYSPHGRWVNDELEHSDGTTIDDGDVSAYIGPNMATGNGFAEICPIRSRMQWAVARDQRFAASRAFQANLFRSRVRDKAYKSSPLKSSMVPGDVPSAETGGHLECQAGQDEEKELLDNVSDLPGFAPPQSRSVQGDSRNPLKGPLRRRNSSIDLRTTSEASQTITNQGALPVVRTSRSSTLGHTDCLPTSSLSTSTTKPLSNCPAAPKFPTAETTSDSLHHADNLQQPKHTELPEPSSGPELRFEKDLSFAAAISRFSSSDSETSPTLSTLNSSSDAITLTSTPTDASELNEDEGEGENISKPFMKLRAPSKWRRFYEKIKNRVCSSPRNIRAKSKRMFLPRMVRKIVAGCSSAGTRPWHVV